MHIAKAQATALHADNFGMNRLVMDLISFLDFSTGPNYNLIIDIEFAFYDTTSDYPTSQWG